MKKYFFVSCLFLFVSLGIYAQKANIPYDSDAPNSYIFVFDKLQNNEEFHINFTSSGCFHRVKEVMSFEKENDSYYVTFNEKRKKLTRAHIKSIRKFEQELARQNRGGCTTTDTYLISYNGITQNITDGSCSWRGYYNLKKAVGF